MSWAAFNYGSIGAAWTWFVINFLYFMIYPTLVHRRVLMAAGGWFYIDIALIIGVQVGVAFVGTSLIDLPHDQSFFWVGQILAVGLCTVGAGSIVMWARRVHT